MSGREVGYYGPSDDDLGKGCIIALVAALGIPLIVALFAFSLQGEAQKQNPSRAVDAFVDSVLDVPINAGDERAMHAAGLPTKADGLEWHETGRWGYGRYEDGEYVVRTFDELPDGAAVWDEIYGLDNADPAFRFQ